MKLRAVIDIGTNTILCLVVEEKNHRFHRVHDWMEIPRLGEGLSTHGSFSPTAMDRSFQVLEDYQKRLHALGIEPRDIAIIATAGMRRASNANEFIDRIRERLNITITTISGETEALYAFRAVQFGLERHMSSGDHVRIFDVGGGSTEIIEGELRRGKISCKESLPLGSVWLHETYLHHEDPPREASWTSLLRAIDDVLDQQSQVTWNPTSHLVGMAGTVTSIGAISLGLTSYDPDRVHGLFVPADKVLDIANMLRQLPTKERIARAGLKSERADIIVAGAAIVCRILERSKAPGLWISDHGIRHGFLYGKE